jgi:glutamyl-tRNA synthetase
LRRERYREVAEKLVASGHAYRCDCTAEQLEAERRDQMARKVPPGYGGRCRERNVSSAGRHVIRLKVPRDRTIHLDDAIRGRIEWSDVALRDTVLLKSDGFPTYHLAVVVDDHDMQISHVLRGEEWLATAPIHVLTFDALGWERPVFAHLPSVLGPDGKKLSKRHGAADIRSFRDAGFLPAALLNYLMLVGWAPGEGDEQEIFTREEMIRRFKLSGVSSAGAVFSEQKLRWMNGMYIRKLSLHDLGDCIRPFLESAGFVIDEERFRAILPSAQTRLEVLTEAPALLGFLFQEPLVRDLDSLRSIKGVDRDGVRTILRVASDS